ncbi:MAG: hypothetical protein ACO3EP_07590 [Phycisphaerales bacterium]
MKGTRPALRNLVPVLAMLVVLGMLGMASSIDADPEADRRGASSGTVPMNEAIGDRAQVVMADGRRNLAAVALPLGERRIVEWRRPDGDRDESASFGEVVAILWVDRDRSARTTASMSMQNGERYPGRLDRAEGVLRWMHPWLGAIAIDLEATRSLRIEGASSDSNGDATAESDRVRLANGDLIEGLVAEIDREVEIESLADGSIRRVPLEVVSRIDFLDSPRPPGAVRLEARDGTVVDVASFRTSPSSLREALRRGESATIELNRPTSDPSGGSAAITLPLHDFSAILLAPSRITMLASLTPEVEAIDGSDRYWLPIPSGGAQATPIGEQDVELSGPIRVRYRIAKGMVLSADASLPDTMRRFGDFELRILDGSREVLRHRFSRESPSVSIAAAIASGELVLELHEGLHGPVQDRLLLESPMLIAPAR